MMRTHGVGNDWDVASMHAQLYFTQLIRGQYGLSLSKCNQRGWDSSDACQMYR